MTGEEHQRYVGEPKTDAAYLSVEQAASRLGVTVHRLRSYIATHAFPIRGARRDPFFAASDLAALADGLGARLPSPSPSAISAPPTAGVRPLATVANSVILGDAIEVLRTLESGIAQAAVTSPPFWGQRVYADERAVKWRDGSEVAFGREETPEEYAEHSADVIVEIARVLNDRGTIWWNIGDSYLTRTILHGSSAERIKHYGGARSAWTEKPHRTSAGHAYLKDKDLTLVPFLVAMAAQRRGLWLRSVIVWSKQQPAKHADAADDEVSRAHMPEPVADRPVTGHEYVLLFTKSDAYDYHPQSLTDVNGDATRLNVRTVWSFRPASKSDSAHGARFPDEMPRRCIALGSQPGELVIDPFAGQGTTLTVAAEMGRRFLGVEVSPTYAEEARAAIAATRTSQPAVVSGVSRGSRTPTL